MEPMYSPVQEEPAMANAVERDPVIASAATRPSEAAFPPAFLPGALDLLRERVARMREELQPSVAAPASDGPVPPSPAAVHLPVEGTPVPPSAPTLVASAPDGGAADAAQEGPAPADLSGELADLKERIGHLESGAASAQLNAAVATLGRKIDLLNAKALDPVAMRRLELQTGDLRAAVERALALHHESAARQAADQKAAEAQMAAADANVVPFTEYAGAVREATRATLSGQKRVEREVTDLRDRLQGLAERIGDLPEEFSAALSDQVDMLLERVERPGIDAATLSPLVDVIERHLVTLTERVVASQKRLDRLDGIEQALHRIADQVEDLQQTSADASVEALQAVALRLSARDDAPAVLGLKRGLAALEARQLEFEARTEDFLVREVELELQGLAELGRAAQRRASQGTSHGAFAYGRVDVPFYTQVFEAGVRAGAQRAPFADEIGAPRIDLDRRIFNGALGDDTPYPDPRSQGPQARADWLAAAERAEMRDVAPSAPKPHARRLLMLAGRAAVLVAAVGLAGVTVLQIARPGTSYARATPGGIAVATSPDARVPVQAPDLASLKLPNLPAALADAAKAGDPQAAYEVGARLADGRGVPADQAGAVKWLSYAAAKGSVPAAYKLGTIFEYADRNAVEARRLYAWAAERGNLRAMHNLGVMATEGQDGKADWSGAAAWFRKAADLGLADSQHNLAVIQSRGLAGAVDLVDAYKWFALAAAQGDTASARKRDEVAKRSDEASVNRARAMAAAFKTGQVDVAANSVTPKPEWDATVRVERAPPAGQPMVSAPVTPAPMQVAAASVAPVQPPAVQPPAVAAVPAAGAKPAAEAKGTKPAPAAPAAANPVPANSLAAKPATATPAPASPAPVAAAGKPAPAAAGSAAEREFTFGPPPVSPSWQPTNPRT